MQPETAFKRQLDRAFQRLFAPQERYRTPIEKGRGQKSGLPDRYYAACGAHCWMEAKVYPNGLSALQAAVLPRMARAGSRVVVLTQHPDRSLVLVEEYASSGSRCAPVEVSAVDIGERPFWRRLLQRRSICVFC